ncbi:unnamed protein product [Brugia timori]|uniref:Uncharacterized protein n=1 Tax=Brugia timori TaxID=42155 RepID=A0A3P7WZF3_9BILA|nr:unnamed protein product [Brugia timori]
MPKSNFFSFSADSSKRDAPSKRDFFSTGENSDHSDLFSNFSCTSPFNVCSRLPFKADVDCPRVSSEERSELREAKSRSDKADELEDVLCLRRRL